MDYNFPGSNFASFTNKFINNIMEGGITNNPRDFHNIITIIINTITSPLTVLLVGDNGRDKNRILLASLVATDVLTGLITQTLFILCRILQLLGMNEPEVPLCSFHYSSVHALSLCSCFCLM